MVTLVTVEQQLKAVGCNFRFWGRAELRELCEILLPGETIAQAVNGQYDAGFALLVATDFRVLLIDKKPKYLTLKDIRFDMITELDFAARMVNSTIRIYTPNKELRFTSTNNRRLRKLFTYTQHKVMEIRNRFMMQQFAARHEMANTPPGVIMASGAASGAPQLPPAPMQQPLMDAPPPMQQIEPTSFYTPEPEPVKVDPVAVKVAPVDDGSTEVHKKLAAAMGAAGLESLITSGRIVKEYVTPFQQRWKKRPYGFTHDSVPNSPQQQPM
jgi:hypothetical protein